MQLTFQSAIDKLGLREAFIAALAIVVGIIALLFVFGAQSRFTHPLWLDESITAFIANDDSFTHMLRAIRGGAENNPPTFYLILWPTARVFGGLGTVGLRVFAGLAMVVALTGVYATGRLFADRTQAAIGVLVVAAHPIVIGQMFEARFYGAWLAASAWFAFAMCIRATAANRRRVLFWRCALAVLVATLHWFGILVVVLIAIGAAVRAVGTPKRNGETSILIAMPVLCAMLGVAFYSPFLISQRSGLTVPTWIEPTTGPVVLAMAYRLFVNASALVTVAFVVVAIVHHQRTGRRASAELANVAPFWTLLLFPVIITGVSIFVQPLLYERYLIPAVLSLGVLAAWAVPTSLSRVGRWVSVATIVVLVVAMGREMRQYSRAVSITDWRIGNAVSAVDRVIATGGARPIVFMRRFEAYPVVQQRPDLAASVALVDFDDVPDSLMVRTVFERDMGRRISRLYPSHRLARLDSLRRGGEFVVVTSENEESELRRLMSGFTIVRAAPDVYLVRP